MWYFELLSGVQRLTYLGITCAMKTTRSAALDILLILPPRYIFMQSEARVVVHNLMQDQSPLKSLQWGNNQRLQKNHLLGMPVGTVNPKYDFERSFQVRLPTRED